MLIRNVRQQAVFAQEKMGKVSLAAGAHLYAGLNCFLPGQEHRAHVHDDQDKMYLVLSGRGEAQVGGETYQVAEGDLILATAGVVHGLKNSGDEPLTVLVVFGPPPKGK
jgi:quercetin dioxygenase-like cupin family protein